MKMNKKVINLLLIFLVTFSILISTNINSKAETLLESTVYKVDSTEKIITTVEPETDINTFKDKFNINKENIKIYKDKEKKEEITQGMIGTGMYLNIENNMYLISVVGDIDGDGKSEQLDLTNIIKHIVGLKGKELQGIYYKSADLTLDGKVDQRDVTKFIKYIVIGELDLGKEDLTPPILEIEVISKSSDKIKVKAKALDKESGMGENPEFIFYSKKATENNYVQVQKGPQANLELSNLEQNTEYHIKVETQDKSGNKAEKEIKVITDLVPEIIENRDISFENLEWNNGEAKLKVTTNSEYMVEYQVNSTTGNWKRINFSGNIGEIGGLHHNDTIYIRLTDGNNSGNYITYIVKDTIKPTISLNLTSTTSQIEATATASDDEAGLETSPTYTFYIKETSEPDSSYVQKQNNTNNVCTITGLSQNISYTVKVEVIDLAGNTGSVTKDITTSGIPDGTVLGNITFGSVTWNSGKASLPISTSTNYKIEYQVNSTTSNWTTSSTNGATITVDNLNYNDIVYARLTDGANSGNYTSITITDTIKPVLSLSLTSTTSQIEATATANDNEAGLGTSPTYTFYIKETSQSDSSYVQKQSNTNSVCTITGLSQNISYTVKVEVTDLAGNTASATKDITTSGIPDGAVSGNITFGSVTWTSGKASLPISTSTNYKIEYQVNSINSSWTTSSTNGGTITVNNLNHNDIVYARLTDGANSGNYASITILDAIKPTISLSLTSTTSQIVATATANDNEAGLGTSPTYTFYIKEASQSDNSYVQKQSNTNSVCTITGLSQNISYTVKVEVTDLAGNIGSTTKEITTSGIPDGAVSGNITFGNVTWTSGKATLPISTSTNYKIEYQVNSTTSNWTTSSTSGGTITVNNLNHNDIVYARLTDGANSGNYASITVKDTIKPTVSLSATENKTQIVVTATASDNETGLGTNPTYTFYIKETSQSDSSYVQKQSNTNSVCTITGLSQNISYTVKVEVIDLAGNIGSTTKEITTSGIPDGTETGAIIFGNVQWNNSVASVQISTNTNYIIEYQVNSTTGEWSAGETGGEPITAIFLNNNDVVYARLTDGTYYGNMTSLTIKDSIQPQLATINLSVNKLVTGENVEATITHIDNETGIKIDSCRWVINQYGTAIGTNTTYYTGGAFTKNDEQISATLSEVGTFYLHVLSVDNAGNKKETISEAIVVEEPKTLASQVEIGDYVLYDATNNYTYTSLRGAYNTGGNGYTDQTFTSSSDIKWRVLKIENDQVVLTSDKSITTTSGKELYLQGATGYLYAEEELNKICSIYGYGIGADTSKVFEYEIGDLVEGTDKKSITDSGARSIKEEDIDIECVTDTTTNSNYGKTYSGNVYYPSRIYSTPRTETRNTKLTARTKVIDSTKVGNELFYLMISCAPKGDTKEYFTADRGVQVWNSGSLGDTTTTINTAYYGITAIYHDTLNNNGRNGTMLTSYLFRSEYESGTRSYSNSLSGGNVRPVVYLKENILTEGKTEDGWTISDKTGDKLNGTITFDNIKWENEEASIEIQNNISTQLKMQYQINNTEGDWITVEDANSYTITGLKNNDIVYARLTDGENFAKYTSLTIIDTIEPEKVDIEVGYETNSSLKVTVNALDNQSGISHYTYVIRNEEGNETKYENILDTTYEIKNLETNTNYTVYVLAYDKANNEAKSEELQAKTTLLLTDSYINKILSLTENTKLTDIYGNRITVPPMFKITNDTKLVTEGIVIEDETGNQFVWVPVGKIYEDEAKNDENAKNITLGRYNTYDETINGYEPVQTEENSKEYVYIGSVYEKAVYNENDDDVNINISNFLKFSNKNGGYYIGRYEARSNTNRTSTNADIAYSTLTEKPDGYVYDYVTKAMAVKACQSMYSNNNFTSDLVNGYAWDTAIIFLQSFGGDPEYGSRKSINDTSENFAEKGTNNETEQDKLCNVYDLNSNAGEYTTEKVTTGGAVERMDMVNGGSETKRVVIGIKWTIQGLSFRPILYFNN